MKKTIGFILMVMLIVLLLSACQSKQDEFTLYKDLNAPKDQILLYNIPKQKLGLYDKNNKTWESLFHGDNLFQYVFENDSEYVVSGHSIKNGFVLLKIGKGRTQLTKVFDLNNNNDCFFPLAHKGGRYYYVLYEDEKNTEQIKRSIFTFDENYKMQKILSTNQLITSGLIIDESLYYTVYEPDKDHYVVYSIPLNEAVKQPQLVKSDLETRDLYNIGNELFFSSRERIFNDKKTFEKKYENFVVGNLLIQMYDDANNDMACSITDMNSNKVINIYKQPINFEVKGRFLYLYCEDNLYEIPVGV